MPQLQITHPYTPALRRSIELALVDGLTGDAEQAAVEHRSHKSIADRWQRIAEELEIPEGRRRRDRVILELFRQSHARYLALALAAYLGALPLNTDAVRTPRTLRGFGPVATVRREGNAPGLALDLDTGSLTWSWV